MKTKKQNGFVIELMIVFMLVTFGLCMLILTFVSSLAVEKKIANQAFERQTTLNQIGEYYLRSVEAGQNFPTLQASDNLNSYDWIKNDSAAKTFFTDCKGNYTFTKLYFAKRAGLLEFYAEKSVWHKLIVKSNDNKVQMIVIVVETKEGNNEANYEIRDWSISDIDESAEYAEEEDLTVLQKLWIWLGNLIQNWRDYFNG